MKYTTLVCGAAAAVLPAACTAFVAPSGSAAAVRRSPTFFKVEGTKPVDRLFMSDSEDEVCCNIIDQSTAFVGHEPHDMISDISSIVFSIFHRAGQLQSPP